MKLKNKRLLMYENIFFKKKHQVIYLSNGLYFLLVFLIYFQLPILPTSPLVAYKMHLVSYQMPL